MPIKKKKIEKQTKPTMTLSPSARVPAGKKGKYTENYPQGIAPVPGRAEAGLETTAIQKQLLAQQAAELAPLLAQQEQVPQVVPEQAPQQPGPNLLSLQGAGNLLAGKQVGGIQTGLGGVPNLQAGTLPLGLGGGVLAAAQGAPNLIGGAQDGLSLLTGAQTAAKTAMVAKTGAAVKTASIFSSGLLKWTVGVATATFGLNKLLGTPDRRIRSADTAMSQIRETISGYPAAVKNGAMSPAEALEGLDDLELEVNRLESAIKTNSIFSVEDKLNPDFTLAMLIRANKLRVFLGVARSDVLLAANQPNPNVLELNKLIEELGGDSGEPA